MIELRSISDDDLCAGCHFCDYHPGERSSCAKGWPGTIDEDGYVIECDEFMHRYVYVLLRNGDGAVVEEHEKLGRDEAKKLVFDFITAQSDAGLGYTIDTLPAEE